MSDNRIDTEAGTATAPGSSAVDGANRRATVGAAVAGIVAAVAAWLVDRLPRFDLDDNTVFFELTSGAAWTLLLVFISAMAGVGIGRLVAGRKLRATSA